MKMPTDTLEVGDAILATFSFKRKDVKLNSGLRAHPAWTVRFKKLLEDRTVANFFDNERLVYIECGNNMQIMSVQNGSGFYKYLMFCSRKVIV